MELPRPEQEEVLRVVRTELQEAPGSATSGTQYIDQSEALAAAERIFTERAELFKKLAE